MTALGTITFAMLAAVAPFMGDYQVYLLSLTLVWGILALGMGLMLGYVGEINFGQAAFVAIAGYTSSLLRMKLGFSFWFAAPISLALVLVLAACVGVITFRLRGPFFALVTLAFGEIVRLIIANWQDLTNGPLGLREISPPESLFGIDFGSKLGFYYLALAVLAACTAALARLVRARTGRLLVAVREDSILAEFTGIHVMRQKVIGLSVSAVVAGLGGVLIAPFLTVLSPAQFSIFASVDMVVMVVVGGIGTLAGPLIGAVFLIYVPELLSFTREFRPVMIGALLIVMTMFMPGGILGLVRPLCGVRLRRTELAA
jgi:branched-chain amino acid transport system permease protein